MCLRSVAGLEPASGALACRRSTDNRSAPARGGPAANCCGRGGAGRKALCPLSYRRANAPGGIRTHDLSLRVITGNCSGPQQCFKEDRPESNRRCEDHGLECCRYTTALTQAGTAGLEPTTCRLTSGCSSAELRPLRVARAGVEPASRAHEAREVPFLHRAAGWLRPAIAFDRSSQSSFVASVLVRAALPPFGPGSRPTWRGFGARAAGSSCPVDPFSLGRGLGYFSIFFKLGITFLVCFELLGNERGRPAGSPSSVGAVSPGSTGHTSGRGTWRRAPAARTTRRGGRATACRNTGWCRKSSCENHLGVSSGESP